MDVQFRAPALVLLLSSLIGVSCTGSGDDPTGPGGTNTGSTHDIRGTWTLEAGGSASPDDWHGNSEFVVVLEIEQTGGLISGRSHSGRSLGSVSGWDVAFLVASDVPGDALSGSIVGDQVELNIRTSSKQNSRSTFTGTISSNGMAGSGWSAVRGGKTVPAPPAAPSNLTAELKPNEEILFTWSDNSDNEDGFLFFEKCDLGDWHFGGALQANTTAATRSGPFRPVVACDFRVHSYRVVDSEYATSDPSGEVTVHAPF
jgi:hypothetical protein